MFHTPGKCKLDMGKTFASDCHAHCTSYIVSSRLEAIAISFVLSDLCLLKSAGGLQLSDAARS